MNPKSYCGSASSSAVRHRLVGRSGECATSTPIGSSKGRGFSVGAPAPGFALVVTLMLTALLTVLVLGLLKLSVVTMRTASQSQVKAVAQANARMALMLSVGELQKSVGPDQRITAPSVTRFDPMDRPAPEFMVKNGTTETAVKVPMTYIAGPFSTSLRDNQYLDFFVPGAETPVLSTVVPPALRKDLLLVFIPVKDSFEILKIHAPPSAIQGGDHFHGITQRMD